MLWVRHCQTSYPVQGQVLLAHFYESTESYCCHPDVGVGIDITLSLAFKQFYCFWTGIIIYTVLSDDFDDFLVFLTSF